jgi:hypothetical protein
VASSGWQRRNELARSRGYRNYYDYRVHDFGRVKASKPPAKGARLERLRGHLPPGDRTDLIRAIKSGRVEQLQDIPLGKDVGSGEITSLQIDLQMVDGSTLVFVLAGDDLVGDRLGDLEDVLGDSDVEVYSRYVFKGLSATL